MLATTGPGGGGDPPGVAPVYAPDRKAEQLMTHLAGFKRVLQVDGYGGYRALAERGDVELAFCCATCPRIYELAVGGAAPIANEALQRMAALYAVEREISGHSVDQRRSTRQEKSRPIVESLEPGSKSSSSSSARRAGSPRRRVRRRLRGADDGDRQVAVLAAVLSDGLAAVEAACREALGQGVHSADVILNILARRRDPAPALTILAPEALRLGHVPAADCSRYDSLRRAS